MKQRVDIVIAKDFEPAFEMCKQLFGLQSVTVISLDDLNIRVANHPGWEYRSICGWQVTRMPGPSKSERPVLLKMIPEGGFGCRSLET